MRYDEQQLRRAMRTAFKVCDVRLTADEVRLIAGRIQKRDEHDDDVQFIDRISRRLTRWRVRVGTTWVHLDYDTHRHAVDAFLHKEQERPDVDSETRVDSTH